jgi:TonB family protein
VAVPQSKPLRSLKLSDKVSDEFDCDPLPESSSDSSRQTSENLDERAILSSLKELIAAGDHGLDPILETITDVARQLTRASAAALAMWKEGAMVCRARSGDSAPVLGVHLSANTGISGECLRTGKIQHCVDTETDPLVDLEVCRGLGVRSIAVLPIRGWRGVNGILEVFSTNPAAFTGKQIAFLQKLAVLAERARKSQSESAYSDALPLPSAIRRQQPEQWSALPVSDRVWNFARASRGTRWPFVLGVIALAAISLLAWAIWRARRAPDRANGKAPAASYSAGPASSTPANVRIPTPNPAAPDTAIAHPGGDTLGRENSGSQLISLELEKPSAVSPVKLASKVDTVAGTKTPADQTRGIAANTVVKYGPPHSQNAANIGSHPESTSLEIPSMPDGSTSSSTLSGVLSAKASLPGLSIPVSQGISGGQLVYRVSPVYPAQARPRRLEGRVVLAAVIMEDGTLRDIKVIDGQPLLAQSAVDAVKRWRYKPYELDGKPVKNEIRINVDFKYPSYRVSP